MASSSSPVDPNIPELNDFGIIDAASYGDMIKKLKEKRDEIGDEGKFRRMCDSEIDYNGFNVLHLVAEAGELEQCKFLVEEVGVDIHVRTLVGETPLLLAVKKGHLLIAEYLIERGADIMGTDSKGFTAFHCALEHANKEFLIMLLKKGADIDADSVSGTPLHYAANLGSADIVKFLLENNAEPNSVSKYLSSSTPLISAIYTNKAECVELLLKAGADPNIVCANVLTPLGHAIESKSNDCIDALLAAGADVDSVSFFGLRPIEQASFCGNLEAFSFLIKARPRLMATPDCSPCLALLNTLENVEEANKEKDIYFRMLREKGNDAWDKQDYSSAIASYSQAIQFNPRDYKVFANRSLCWARMGEGECALNDAHLCVDLKPNWGKAHLSEATAWHLLKLYGMSADTFKRAFGLAPENEDIER